MKCFVVKSLVKISPDCHFYVRFKMNSEAVEEQSSEVVPAPQLSSVSWTKDCEFSYEGEDLQNQIPCVRNRSEINVISV